MQARIAVLDFTGTLLGPALGLRTHGNEVRYFTPGSRSSRPGYVAAVLDRFFAGGDAEPCFDADLVVYCESFSDAWWALQHDQQMDAPCDQAHPLAASIHPLQLEVRLDALCTQLQRVNQLVTVDMSDLGEPLHPAFLELPGRKLKRECLPAQRTLGIAPFPFLYNPVLLALDRVWGLGAGRPRDATIVRDGWFCGTIDHPRYGGTRRNALDAILARHPGAHLDVHDGGVPTLENLRETQRSRSVLHPPGRGAICLRTHEALFFGVPLLVAQGFSIAMPPGHERIFSQSLDALPTRDEVVGFYAEHYAPEAAASFLQDVVAVPT